MSVLAQINHALKAFNQSVEAEVQKARADTTLGAELQNRWQQIRAEIPAVETPTGLKLPRLALPGTDEPGEIARYLHGEGLPGEFPFLNGAYREMYLQADSASKKADHKGEEPTRLFAGLGLASSLSRSC